MAFWGFKEWSTKAFLKMGEHIEGKIRFWKGMHVDDTTLKYTYLKAVRSLYISYPSEQNEIFDDSVQRASDWSALSLGIGAYLHATFNNGVIPKLRNCTIDSHSAQNYTSVRQ